MLPFHGEVKFLISACCDIAGVFRTRERKCESRYTHPSTAAVAHVTVATDDSCGSPRSPQQCCLPPLSPATRGFASTIEYAGKGEPLRSSLRNSTVSSASSSPRVTFEDESRGSSVASSLSDVGLLGQPTGNRRRTSVDRTDKEDRSVSIAEPEEPLMEPEITEDEEPPASEEPEMEMSTTAEEELPMPEEFTAAETAEEEPSEAEQPEPSTTAAEPRRQSTVKIITDEEPRASEPTRPRRVKIPHVEKPGILETRPAIRSSRPPSRSSRPPSRNLSRNNPNVNTNSAETSQNTGNTFARFYRKYRKWLGNRRDSRNDETESQNDDEAAESSTIDVENTNVNNPADKTDAVRVPLYTMSTGDVGCRPLGPLSTVEAAFSSEVKVKDKDKDQFFDDSTTTDSDDNETDNENSSLRRRRRKESAASQSRQRRARTRPLGFSAWLRRQTYGHRRSPIRGIYDALGQSSND